MPKLPSGLDLALSRYALFDHGGNWQACPPGHFWYWVAAPEEGNAPFDPDRDEIMQIAEHAVVPKDREEAKRFVRVLEMRDDGKYGWRGEWLDRFPQFTPLDNRDRAAWNEWLARPEIARLLDEVVAECARLAEVSGRAQGYTILTDPAEPDEEGWGRGQFARGGTLEAPDGPSDIDAQEVSEEFAHCWKAAGLHFETHLNASEPNWLKADINPPFLEHLSFRVRNQLFFIRIEDVDQNLVVPGSRTGLLSIAEGCNGYPCLMPMQLRDGRWMPERDGWGLLDVRTGAPIDPLALASDELIEMTDWELQDFAVQVVRGSLEKAGRQLIGWHGNPAVTPSIWFVGDKGPEWIVVRAVRYPALQAEPPADWQRIADGCARLSNVGHFASVSVANADDPFDPSGALPPLPLWRDRGLIVRYDGLVPADKISA